MYLKFWGEYNILIYLVVPLEYFGKINVEKINNLPLKEKFVSVITVTFS